jgi:hypothetical protein
MEAPQLRRINLGFLATLAQLQAAFSVRRLSEQCSLVFANARSWQKSLHENQPCPIASKFRLGATRPASNAQCLTVKRESFLQSLPVVRGDFTTRCKCKDCETPGLPVVSTAAREPLLTAGNPGQVPRPPRGSDGVQSKGKRVSNEIAHRLQTREPGDDVLDSIRRVCA